MASAKPARPGALVISLDFELAWGTPGWAMERYAANLYGERVAIPRLLALFEEYGVAATWAVVGFLFARSREELSDTSPPTVTQPAYAEAGLDPYAEPVGWNEDDDPLHYAPSLIERVLGTPRQEIATHTFSHYNCLAPGQTAETFRADIAAARTIAARRGVEITSIVFPRNQHNPAYDSIVLEQGITAYRGNPRSWMWRPSSVGGGMTLARRAARFVDSHGNLSGHGAYAWSEVLQPSGLSNVRASAFLRPASPGGRPAASLRLRRIRQGLQVSARCGEIYHLWWHPHNFGRHVDENLAALRVLLDEFARLRDAWGMASLSMRDVDRAVRETETTAGVSTPTGRPSL